MSYESGVVRSQWWWWWEWHREMKREEKRINAKKNKESKEQQINLICELQPKDK